MARVIAIVTELSGKFFAKDAKGNIVELQKGDEIFEGMIVYGDSANAASDTINIHAYSGEEIALASNQEQLFDVTMVDAELADLDSVIAEESIAAIIAENTPQKTQEEEEEDIFEEETAAGDEKAKKDADVAGDFAVREGNMADVNSGLRSANFKVQSRSFEIKSAFEREDDMGIDAIETTMTAGITPPRPTPIANPIPSPIGNGTDPKVVENIIPIETPEPAPKAQAPAVFISIGDVTVNEATGVATLTVTLSNSSTNSISVDYATANGTTEGGDYTPTNGTITFAPNETSKTIEVAITNDGVYEGSEALYVNLTNPTGGATISDAQGAITVKDDGAGAGGNNNDMPTLLINDVTVNEGDKAVFSVSISNASTEDITFDLSTTAGSAAQTNDYMPSYEVSTDGGNTWSSATSATIAAGSTSLFVRVPTVDDATAENSETFTLNATVTSGTTTNQNASGEATILDNDAPSISINDVTVNEATGVATLTVTLSNSSTNSISVDYATANGTTEGSDYTPTNGTITFAAGETSKTIEVAINNDNTYEGSETLYVNLTNPTGGATISDAQGAITVKDDGEGSVPANTTVDNDKPQMSINDVTVEEGSKAIFSVTVGEADVPYTVTFNTTTNGTAEANDITAPIIVKDSNGNTITANEDGSYTVPANMTSLTVEVSTVVDGVYEGSETFELNGKTEFMSTDVFGTGTIKDDGTATDGDDTGTDIDNDNRPVVTTCEDTAYTFAVADFNVLALTDSVRIDSLPIDGTLRLDGVAVTQGEVISKTDIDDGKFTFLPDANESGRDEYNTAGTGDQKNDYAAFDFTLSNGSTSTMTIDVTPVIDGVDLSMMTGELTAYNIAETSKGYTVTAYDVNGNVTTISTVKNTDHDGFGVGSDAGNDGAATEIQYNGSGSETLSVKFDNLVDTAEMKYAWVRPGETAVMSLYKDGQFIESFEFADGTDKVDGPFTVQCSDGGMFDELRFTAKGWGDDYIIHSVSYKEVIPSEVGGIMNLSISAILKDADGSESIDAMVISDIPVGMTLSDGVNSFVSTEGTTSKDITGWNMDALKIIVPAGHQEAEYTLKVAVTTKESLAVDGSENCPLTQTDVGTFTVRVKNDVAIDTAPALSLKSNPSHTVTFFDQDTVKVVEGKLEISTNLVVTLDVSGSMSGARLDLAKESLVALINQYKAEGTTYVNLTTFSSSGNNIGWMDADTAIATINNLSANGWTNYEAAIKETTQNIDFTGYEASRTLAYFISDGDPTQELKNDGTLSSTSTGNVMNSLDGTSEDNKGATVDGVTYGRIDQEYYEMWKDFTTNQTNGVETTTIGLGSGLSSDGEQYLNMLAGAYGGEALFVEDSVLELTAALSPTEVIEGNIFDLVESDSDITIDSITIGGVLYTDSLTDVAIDGKGKFSIDFTTGNYSYTVKKNEFDTDSTKSFVVKVSDANANELEFDVDIHVFTFHPTITGDASNNEIIYNTTAIIDGGDGDDTLVLLSNQGIDFDNEVLEVATIQNIEMIDMDNGSANSLTNLTLADVVAFTGSSNDLVIDGDSADSVAFKAGDAGWEKGASDGTYTTYTNTNDASVTLKIDDDIQQPIE